MSWRTPALCVLAACGETDPPPRTQVVTAVEPCPTEAPRSTLLERATARARACAGDAAVDATDPHLIELVALAYGDLLDAPVRSLDFRTERLTTTEARVVACLVDSYNVDFGGPVSAAIGAFEGRVAGWSFGREGSPVLYAELPHWTSQREGAEGGEGEPIPDADNAALVEALRVAFDEGAHASEFGPDRSDRRIRIWWD